MGLVVYFDRREVLLAIILGASAGILFGALLGIRLSRQRRENSAPKPPPEWWSKPIVPVGTAALLGFFQFNMSHRQYHQSTAFAAVGAVLIFCFMLVLGLAAQWRWKRSRPDA